MVLVSATGLTDRDSGLLFGMRVLLMVVDYFLFLGICVSFPWDLRRTVPRVWEQIYRQGVSAVPLIVFAGMFVGLTTTLQTAYQLLGIVPNYFVGMGVGRMLLIELGPVLAAFVIASRSAPAMAAEIGMMRVSEQIDALRTMAINPYRFLCLPRIFALTISLPMLVMLLELVAGITAILVVARLGVSRETFIYGMTHFVELRDFFGGILKAVVFGLLIGTSGCYLGFKVEGGAQDVGRAATRAMVVSAILILVFDFVMAGLLFS